MCRFIDKEINIYIGLTEMQRKRYGSVPEKVCIIVMSITNFISYFVSRPNWIKEGKKHFMNKLMKVSLSIPLHVRFDYECL